MEKTKNTISCGLENTYLSVWNDYQHKTFRISQTCDFISVNLGLICDLVSCSALQSYCDVTDPDQGRISCSQLNSTP